MTYRVDLGNGLWYDNTPDTTGINVPNVEKHYGCRYVCEWNTISKAGKVNNSPVALFWQEVPHPEGSNWMGVFLNSDSNPYVMDGQSASRLPIRGYVSQEGQVLFSKYRHDFRQSNDGSVTVDGGREYTRLLGDVRCASVWLLPQCGKLVIIDDSAAQLLLSDTKEKTA